MSLDDKTADLAADRMRSAMVLCRRHFLAAAGFSFLVNLLYVAPTLYMLQVYDRVVPTQGLQTLAFLTLVLIFAVATLSLLDRLRTRLLIRAGVQLDAALAPAILDETLGRPELPAARQALREFDALRNALSGPGILAVFDAPWILIYVAVCFIVHPWIGAVALIGCTVLPIITWASERATHSRLEHARVISGASYSSQEALLNAADSIRALGMRRALIARHLHQREAMLSAQTEAGFASGGYLTGTKFVRLMLQSLSLGLGAILAINNEISGGAIFASSFLIARALAPIEQLTATWKPLSQAGGSYKRLAALLGGNFLERVATRLPSPLGAVTLEGLTVFNETREAAIVNSVSLRIDAGQVVAIIGPSGAGKSTLVRAIAGALMPDRGVVRFDGADAKDWDPELLARHIGYLPQDSILLNGTIAENIARFSKDLGEERASVDEAVVAAAERVDADALIRRLAGGYDHQLALGGRGVSAGQAQRIALARAIYGNPQILILDEPNAHLDAEGDAALIKTLAALKAEGRTIVVVSHKLGILPVVDRILVLKAGRVDLFGTRDEVLPKITSSRPTRISVPAAAT